MLFYCSSFAYMSNWFLIIWWMLKKVLAWSDNYFYFMVNFPWQTDGYSWASLILYWADILLIWLSLKGLSWCLDVSLAKLDNQWVQLDVIMAWLSYLQFSVYGHTDHPQYPILLFIKYPSSSSCCAIMLCLVVHLCAINSCLVIKINLKKGLIAPKLILWDIFVITPAFFWANLTII